MDKYSKTVLNVISVCLVIDLVSTQLSKPARADGPISVKIVDFDMDYYAKGNLQRALPRMTIKCDLNNGPECALKWVDSR